MPLSNEEIEANRKTEELLGMTSNPSLSIIRRFMTPKAYEEFVNNYKSNRHGSGFRDRFAALSIPLSIEEESLLKAVLTETNKTMSKIGQEHGIKPTGVSNKVERLAMKFLYQNLDKVEL